LTLWELRLAVPIPVVSAVDLDLPHVTVANEVAQEEAPKWRLLEVWMV
jgi:hypothetical protein